MKKKTAVLVAAGFLLLQAVGCGFPGAGGQTASQGGSAVPVISVSSLGNADAAVSNRFSGVVETQKKKNVSLDPEQSVKEVLVAEGDHILEGDALFTYDTRKTELDIAAKELEKEKLNSSISTYKEQIDQLNSQLAQNNLTSADRMTVNAQIMENQTSIAQAEYDLKVADAEIAGMKASIKNATVRAPMAGTIESIADPEEIHDASEAFIRIMAEGDFRIRGSLSEQSIGTIYEGIPMLVRSRVDDNETWMGTVTSIESSEEEQQDPYMSDMGNGDRASTYSFYVSLDSMEGLMLGQHVTLEAFYGEMSGMVLPMSYILQEEDGSSWVFAVDQPGSPLEKRAVETGEYYPEQDMIQILGGLEESAYVAWPNNEDCVEGAPTSANAFAEDGEGLEG